MCVLALAAFTLAPAQEEEKEKDIDNPHHGKQEMVEAGRKLYLNSCSACHGPTGEGGRGPGLIKSGMIRGASNRRLFTTIKDGVRGSDMPPSTLDDGKIWQIVTFVKYLNAPAYETSAAGNADAGERLFFGKAGCVECHSIRGRGGVLGPDLSGAGLTRTYAHLRESLLNPDERPTDGYQGVSIQLKSGRRVEGVARNQTNYSLQVLDAKGGLHLLSSLDIEQVSFRKGSLMPGDYKTRLSKSEIDDLLAFLSRQVIRVPEKEK